MRASKQAQISSGVEITDKPNSELQPGQTDQDEGAV